MCPPALHLPLGARMRLGLVVGDLARQGTGRRGWSLDRTRRGRLVGWASTIILLPFLSYPMHACCGTKEDHKVTMFLFGGASSFLPTEQLFWESLPKVELSRVFRA